MPYRSKMSLSAFVLFGLLVAAGCDRRDDEYTSPQDRSGETGTTTGEPMTPPAATPSPPPAGGGER